MINSLKLTNFRQHLDRTFDFSAGINAIRGGNEAGKTTVLESFAYLCFGARAMRESLDDVVTYGQPTSKLRVEGTLTHLGVTYNAYRAKSGAEVTFGNERVTGQTEVTRFFELLFGADAEMAGKLMIANQKSLADSLTAGAAEAGRMIENLANFSLIDDIVEMVQNTVVSGVTTGVEARIAQLKGQVAEVVEVEDIAPLEAAAEAAKTALDDAALAQRRLVELRDELDIDQAKQIIADEKAHQATIETTAYEMDQLDRALAVAAPVAPTDEALAAARAAVEAEKGLERAAAVHAELVKAGVTDEWDKDLAALEAEVSKTQGEVTEALARRGEAVTKIADVDFGINKLQRESAAAIATLEGKLIKESTCAFCDKDLTDVPEVVQRNSSVGRELADLRAGVTVGMLTFDTQRTEHLAARDGAGADLKVAEDYLTDLRAVLTRNDKVETLYAKAGDLITVDRSTVPGLWTWAGPKLEGERPNVFAALRALEQEQKEAVTAAATRVEKKKQRDLLKAKQDAAVLSRNSLQIKDAVETIGEAAVIDGKLLLAKAKTEEAKEALASARAALSTKVELQKQAAAAAELTKKQLAAAEAELVELAANNALIKKVRLARPVITDQLWSIVLAGVTKYFSEVRGEFSAITREDKMFKCGGHPAAGLSGSAQDMLGLAIRIALTKTFLPGCDFLLLDEPAAACSDYRESAMLGMLSTLGFGQIIMVTHSPQVDAFCDTVVTI